MMDKIIEAFRNLDLSTNPEKEIRELFNSVEVTAGMSVTFHKGKSVMRARPNYNGEKFSKKSDFSFKPQKNNDTYQRASTPYQTMFYGAVLPEDLREGELDNARIIGALETVPLLRDKNKSGYQKISFGRWFVKEDINLIAIVFNEEYIKKNRYTSELANSYKEFCKYTDPDIVEKSNKFQSFLASEFSKETIRNNYDYMISAIYSELVTKKGYDGVFYPSVRVAGEGFNVALTPEATEKLELKVVGECSLYKLKENAVLGLDSILEINDSDAEFVLDDSRKDEEECLKGLGLTSIAELINL
jgi:hypothetical protein